MYTSGSTGTPKVCFNLARTEDPLLKIKFTSSCKWNFYEEYHCGERHYMYIVRSLFVAIHVVCCY
jgi:acyl-coenzyme A synthetase/AMP-(fatty) acid ligase